MATKPKKDPIERIADALESIAEDLRAIEARFSKLTSGMYGNSNTLMLRVYDESRSD